MVDAVGPTGDIDQAVVVDCDPARRVAAVRAVAVQPRLGLVPVDIAAADLPAGGLADVARAAPVVQADPFESRDTPIGPRPGDGVLTTVTVMSVRGWCRCHRGDHGHRDRDATAQCPRPTLGFHRLSFGSRFFGTPFPRAPQHCSRSGRPSVLAGNRCRIRRPDGCRAGWSGCGTIRTDDGATRQTVTG